MQLKYNALTGEFDLVGMTTTEAAAYLKLDQTVPQTITGDGSIIGLIPQLNTDPVAPAAETAWVLRSGSFSGGGSPIGLLLALTEAGTGSYTYQFSYKPIGGAIIRASLS